MKSAPQRAVTRRMMRLGQILKTFLAKETVVTSWICDELGVNARTIQRDIKALRDAGIPVHEKKKGEYSLDKDLFKDLEVFDEVELALIVALKDLVSQLGKPFEKAADDLLGRICDYTACRPVYVKVDSGIQLNSKIMNKVVKAIQGGRQVSFQYQGSTTHGVVANPYRVAYFDGAWYLVARDANDSIIKKYSLDRVSDIMVLKTPSGGMPKNLDQTLRESVNVWFSSERAMEVVIEVDPSWAHYFKRRWILPQQEVMEERRDGSLLVRFSACSKEEIVMCLKPWLPHIRAIQPDSIKKLLLDDFRKWMKWQEGI
jgi:predicted DNA-binding transcriptional regulator YafY